MKTLITAALLALATSAGAEDLQLWHITVSPFGAGVYWLPQLAFFEKLGDINDTSGISVGPTDGVTIDLGRPEAPWSTIYASQYVAGGQAGLTANVNAGNGCVLSFRGGLLVAVHGGSFFQPCTQP